MVLRGQPVGEQGAADRWTALDPHRAGSGSGAPRGHPRGAPFFYAGESPLVQIDIDEPRGLPAPRLICFEIDLTGYLLG